MKYVNDHSGLHLQLSQMVPGEPQKLHAAL